MAIQCSWRWAPMVKIGFICEGKSDKVILKSEKFRQFLKSIGLENSDELITFVGSEGDLIPEKRTAYRKKLEDKGAEKIFILRDFDQNNYFSELKSSLLKKDNEEIIFPVKQIESWFLADNETLSDLFKTTFHFNYPEKEDNPFQTIKNLSIQHRNKGFGSELLMARCMINAGYDIINSANHPNCNSAKYFIKKLQALNSN